MARRAKATTPNAGSATNDPLQPTSTARVFGDDTSGETATVGPFDPEAANETLLSDGESTLTMRRCRPCVLM